MFKTFSAAIILATFALIQPAVAEESRFYNLGDMVGQRILTNPDVTILYIGFDRANNTATFSMKPKVCSPSLPPDNLSFDLKIGQMRTFMVKTECGDSGCRSYTVSLYFKAWDRADDPTHDGIMVSEEIKVVSAPTN